MFQSHFLIKYLILFLKVFSIVHIFKLIFEMQVKLNDSIVYKKMYVCNLENLTTFSYFQILKT